MAVRTLRCLFNQVGDIEERLVALQERRQQLLDQAHELCSHPIEQVRQAPPWQGIFGFADPPFRVCLVCGLAEEGWRKGYDKLYPNVFSGILGIERGEARQFVRTYRPKSETWERRRG